MDQKIRVIYIDDYKIIQEGINLLLSQEKQFEVLHYENFDALKILLHNKQVDIVIVDLQLNNLTDKNCLNGYQISELVRSDFPQTGIVVHSMYDFTDHINKAFIAGANAFVSKQSGYKQLIQAIFSVQNGERFICLDTQNKIKNYKDFMSGMDMLLKPISELFTKTEKNVLEKLALGFSTKQIAHQLSVADKTVETHRRNLFDKARVKNVAELIAYSYSNGILMN
jgi:DNA-binding NarL/FixJ family response regulator